MKTLDEILARDDYQKLVPSLRGRAQEIAGRIKNKMLNLEADEIEVNSLGLRIVRGRTSYGPYEYLAIIGGDSEPYCIDGAFSGYIHGDYGRPCSTANNADVLKFLNNARGFVEALGRIEEEKARSIHEALKDVENL